MSERQPRIAYVDQVKPIKAPVDGIPKREGSTAGGPVECEVLVSRLNTDGTVEIELGVEKIDVYNQVTADVLANGERMGMACLHPDGLWWAMVDDCADTGTG